MTDQHPIAPPPELVQQWLEDGPEHPSIAGYIATQVAQWGADQELEACCKWITEQDWTWTSAQLRAARRPKPPSLKEQALERCNDYIDPDGIIRRALEALDD